MKIALLSDIHGNYTALKAVVKEIDDMGITKLFCLGDLVGYYYEPDKVMGELERYDVEYIKGNHEVFLEQAIRNLNEAENLLKKYGSGIETAKKKLNQDQIRELIYLPGNKDIRIGNIKIQLRHAASRENPYVYPDTPDSVKNAILNTEADIICFGHSHYALQYKKSGKTLINPGSVGQNRLEGGIASWAVFDSETKAFELKRTKYDIGSVIDQINETDPENAYLKDVLERVGPK